MRSLANGFAQRFGQMVSIRVKTFKNTNLVAIRQGILKGKWPHFRLTPPPLPAPRQKKIRLRGAESRSAFFNLLLVVFLVFYIREL